MHGIVDTAVAAGSFETLAATLTAANLVGTLKGAGSFTVFAPTEEAFAKLPAGNVEALLADIGIVLFFFFYTVAFTWGFDRVFGLPQSALPRTEGG